MAADLEKHFLKQEVIRNTAAWHDGTAKSDPPGCWKRQEPHRQPRKHCRNREAGQTQPPGDSRELREHRECLLTPFDGNRHNWNGGLRGDPNEATTAQGL